MHVSLPFFANFFILAAHALATRNLLGILESQLGQTNKQSESTDDLAGRERHEPSMVTANRSTEVCILSSEPKTITSHSNFALDAIDKSTGNYLGPFLITRGGARILEKDESTLGFPLLLSAGKFFEVLTFAPTQSTFPVCVADTPFSTRRPLSVCYDVNEAPQIMATIRETCIPGFSEPSLVLSFDEVQYGLNFQRICYTDYGRSDRDRFVIGLSVYACDTYDPRSQELILAVMGKERDE